MTSSSDQALTESQAATFFLSPEGPLHRQYEALRAYFVEELPSAEAALRFSYSPGAFRVLCHQFRHHPEKRSAFFRSLPRAHSAPARDPVREQVVALRKRNLSVYDIQRELAAGHHPISINALTMLLREEGFVRLPRRRDEERPAALKADSAEVADVRRLDLSPRSFRTTLAGLFLFVPLLEGIDLGRVVEAGRLPSSQIVPAEPAVRSLLALKLLGTERKSHVMDRVFDPAVALFAGLNVVPKRSYLAAYSSRVDHRANVRLMDAWFEQLEGAGLPHGNSLDLDFHTVPANTATEPLEKHCVSSRSRRQQGIGFITLRRRSRKMLADIYSRPPSAWQRIALDSLTRTFRTPRVLDEHVTLKGYEGLLRQLTVIELGHEEPTVLLTNHLKLAPATLVTRYAQRMLIENNISESIQFFHIDALSSMVGLKVDFDLQLTLMAGSLYRLMARRIGREYERAQPKTIFRNLLDLSAKVEVETGRVVVTIDKRAHNPYLVASGLADRPARMPWFGNKLLHIRFA
jgi:hypothetical protein